jgi:hypothetical protein
VLADLAPTNQLDRDHDRKSGGESEVVARHPLELVTLVERRGRVVDGIHDQQRDGDVLVGLGDPSDGVCEQPGAESLALAGFVDRQRGEQDSADGIAGRESS